MTKSSWAVTTGVTAYFFFDVIMLYFTRGVGYKWEVEKDLVFQEKEEM